MMMCRTFLRAGALAACVALMGGAASASVSFAGARDNQDKPKQEKLKVPEAEAKAANKVGEAPDPAAKLQAAAEFLKKYPKSTARQQIAEHVAAQVGGVEDAEQRIKFAESYLATFTGPGEADLITRDLLDAFISASREADAFRLGNEWLKQNPEDVDIMRRLAIVASNAAIKGNNAYVAQGQQYGVKAAELLEADKKPDGTDDAKWAEYKTRWLPATYREVGVLAMRANDKAAAKTNMEKAAALKSSDPVVYLVLSDFANDEYNQLAKQYQEMPAGAEKNAQLKKVQETLDRVIEVYAQTVAVTQANAQYTQASQQIRQDLEGYYKYRRGSTQGLQELIDKYKIPASQ